MEGKQGGTNRKKKVDKKEKYKPPPPPPPEDKPEDKPYEKDEEKTVAPPPTQAEYTPGESVTRDFSKTKSHSGSQGRTRRGSGRGRVSSFTVAGGKGGAGAKVNTQRQGEKGSPNPKRYGNVDALIKNGGRTDID